MVEKNNKEIRTLEVIYDCDYIIDAARQLEERGAGAIKFPVRVIVDKDVKIEMIDETGRRKFGEEFKIE